MVLGELSIFKKLLPENVINESKSYESHIPLENLEVVQVYHSTYISYRDAIRTYGLVPASYISDWRSYGPRVFVSSTVEDVPLFGGSADIWTFCVPKWKLKPDEKQQCGNHYYLEEGVPWYNLYLHETVPCVNEWQYELYLYKNRKR